MQLEVGTIVEGKVTGLTAFGAFISLPDGKTGMVHISEVASSYVKEIKDHLTENQTVKCKVLSISDDGKVSLSIKRALEPVEEKSDERKAQRPPRQPKPQSRQAAVWQGTHTSSNTNSNMSFEDMMSRFKQVSDEKMTDLKRSSETKQGGGGYGRRGGSK